MLRPPRDLDPVDGVLEEVSGDCQEASLSKSLPFLLHADTIDRRELDNVLGTY